MKRTLVMLVSALLIVGGLTVAVSTFTDADVSGSFASSWWGSEEGSVGDAQAGDLPQGTSDGEDLPEGPGTGDQAGLNAPHPVVSAPDPGASPMAMTEDLLGPTPEALRTVDDAMGLTEALRQHPSFPSDGPVATPGVPTQGPVENALSRLVQAHGIMTELQTAASEGDPVAEELLPYAAAQLADEASNAGPTFDAASDVYTMGEDAELRLNGEAVPVSQVDTFQEEVDRLYGLIGLPSTPVDAGVHDPTELARLVHATANVVEATHEAQKAAERAESLEGDLERVDAALSDGALSKEDARLVVEVSKAVHEVTLVPIQQRLDALDTLYATSEAVVPALTLSSNTPIHEAQEPLDDVATIQDVIDALSTGQDQHDPDDGLESLLEGVEDVEGAVNETQRQVEQAGNDTQEETEAFVEPVNEALAENFVDPFGAIMILGEDDDHVNGTGHPVPVEVPGVGPVGSLFPRAPLLVVAQGGDNTYESFPRSASADETVQGTGEPLITDDEVIDAIGFDPRPLMTPFPEGGPLGPFGQFLNIFAELTYNEAVEAAEGQQGVELAVVADTPMQVVVDLAGHDTYMGERGAAYAAGGGTSAVYDAAGDDTYDVKRGVGLIEEDGLAIVKSFGGNDTIRADRGVGSVLQPFTVNHEGQAVFDDDAMRYRIGGLGAYVNFEGDNVYDVEEAGIGMAFHQGTFLPSSPPPLVVPVALDLGGESEGFEPVLLQASIEPTDEVETDEGEYVRSWVYTLFGDRDQGAAEGFGGIFLGNDGLTVEPDTPGTRTLAVDRSYEANLTEPTDGRVHVANHNVTVGAQGGQAITAGLFLPTPSFNLHNEILVHLDDAPRVYEPPYPIILIDAGESDGVYHNATPPGMVAETPSALILPGSLYEEDVTLAPNLVLDTRGDDRYTGETASLNTSRLAESLSHDNTFGSTDVIRAPVAGSILADLGGDDTFEGDVASVDVNMTLSASAMTSLVYTAGGSNTIQGGQAGGITVSHAQTAGSLEGLDNTAGHSITSLLLMGTSDEEGERNTIDVDRGSMGSVFVERPGGDFEPEIDASTRLTAASIVAAPSDFTSTDHSFASVRWCKALDECPPIETTTTDGFQETPRITALFIGANAPNTYAMDAPEGLGHVTLDPQACASVASVLGVAPHIPYIITRFVDPAGGNTYEMLDRTEDLPAWRNDASWRGNDCEATLIETLDCAEDPDPEEGANVLNNEYRCAVLRGEEDVDLIFEQERSPEDVVALTEGFQDEGAGEAADLRAIDALGIDNLAQYVLSSTGGSVGPEAQDAAGLEFEVVQLCAGPFAVMENGSTLRGYTDASHRCAQANEASVLSTQPVQDQERLQILTETRSSVPANAFGAINPCDAGQSGDRFLDLDAREVNVPRGNPLAQEVSGCWATLQVKKADVPSSIGPVWDRFAPTGTGWLDVMAAPMHCGYTDDRSMPVKCATDAFPVPYHVDGTSGYDLERWFLPEGTYEYKLTFNGPISMLLGDRGELTGEIRIDRDPMAVEEPVPGYDVPLATNAPAGLLTWMATADMEEEAPGALEGFNVRVVHQDDTGEPEDIEVWSPFIMTQYRDIVPVACLEDTPYRGVVADAEQTWRIDRGHWVATYPLELWEAEPAHLPEGCSNTEDPATLDVQGEPIPVDAGLWHAPSGEEPKRILLPPDAVTDHVVVDETDPALTLTPIPGPDGEPIMELDADTIGTIGLGIEDLGAPRIEGTMRTDDLDDQDAVHIEIPFNVTSESPISEIRFAGVTDNPLQDNTIHEGIELTFEDDEGETTILPCSPIDDTQDALCHTRLNHSQSGQAPDGTWYRHAGLNLTLHLTNSTGAITEVYDALTRSITNDAKILIDVLDNDKVQAEDEAGNSLSKSVQDITLDLSRPTDLSAPCQGDGVGVVTSEDTVQLRTYVPDEDIELLLIERRQGSSWTVQDWVRYDDAEATGLDCEPDAQGQWRAFDYHVQDAAPDEIVRHDLRVIPVDNVGNRGLTFGPFEFSITVDQKTPTLTIEQTEATIDMLTVDVTADQPVTLDPDTILEGPDGMQRAPLFVPSARSGHHELVFEALDVNTTYELPISVLDEAGNDANAQATVQTARTLNVSLAPMHPVAGDHVTIRYDAGALEPVEEGDPMTRVEATAFHDGDVCAPPRSLTQYIDAPVHDPATYTITLPLTECPGGELDLELTIENGPEQAPIESLTLATRALHDVHAPTPSLDVQGEISETGWYTSPVSITATGDDDTGIQDAYIHDANGPVNRLMIDDAGVHALDVTAIDEANRSATDTLEVPIDLAPPSVELVSQDTLPTERSVITVQVLGADDASGLQSIRTLQEDGSFSEWSPVVEDMQLRVDIQGLDEIVAEVRDRAGHVTQAVLPVVSLADPPTVDDGSVTVASPGSVEVHAILDRPVGLEAIATQGDRIVQTATSAPGTEHRFTLEGLVPASDVDVTVRAQLTDGSTARLDALSGTLTLPASQGPPTVPENLRADVLDDGSVKVSWDAALDDAGVERYLVERRTGGELTDQRSVTSTQILDDPAPGTMHAYRVQAIDLSGRTGDWTSPVEVEPAAPLTLVSYEITPEIAPAGSPVTFTVTAQGEDAPSTASIHLGDESVPLALEEASEGRWVYSATVTLPPTDTFFPRSVEVQLGEASFPEEGAFPGPVVKALNDGEASTQADVPLPGMLAALIPVTVALFARRWKL